LPGGCTVFVDLDATEVVGLFSDGSTTGERHFAVPNVPNLSGAEVVLQLFTGPSSNPAGIETSAAIALTLGTF
ncbi:MAG: hypothetical protein ACO3RU_10135, partial [Planctomycetota bacterium]